MSLTQQAKTLSRNQIALITAHNVSIPRVRNRYTS